MVKWLVLWNPGDICKLLGRTIATNDTPKWNNFCLRSGFVPSQRESESMDGTVERQEHIQAGWTCEHQDEQNGIVFALTAAYTVNIPIPVSYSFIWSFAGWWKHVERQQPLDVWSAKLHPSGSWNLGVVLPEIGIFAWSTCRFGVVSALSGHVSTLSTPWYSKLDKFLEMISTRIFSSFLLESWKTTRLNLWILEL